jgi:hypothetical protein
MNQWFFEKAGAQSGPVSLEELQQMARRAEITASTLVWNSTMSGWAPAESVAELKTLITVSSLSSPRDAADQPITSSPSTPQSTSANPYSAPLSGFNDEIHANFSSERPASGEPLDGPSCIKRGWNLTFRHAGTVALCFIVYFAVTWAVSFVTSFCAEMLSPTVSPTYVSSDPFASGNVTFSPSTQITYFGVGSAIINQIVGVFLNLGLIRVCLNLVSGKTADVSQLFGEGSKLLKAFLASILFGLAVAVGLVLLIVPGIYVALRYGQFLYAIVDKNLSIGDAFRYSGELTKDNVMSLFVYAILSILVVLAGLLVFCVGIFIAIPVVTLASAVVYRWLQYGQKAVTDHPNTQTPVIASYIP